MVIVMLINEYIKFSRCLLGPFESYNDKQIFTVIISFPPDLPPITELLG